MGFGRRLALFLIVALLGIQTTTGVAIYELIRRTLISEGEAQLATNSRIFVRELTEMEEHVASAVRVVTQDFALRQAVAQRDRETVLSALRNTGRRVGAERMLLIGLDGRIEADTKGGTASRFQFPSLLSRALDDGRAATVAAIDGKAYWLVTVPVMAPEPIGFIAAALPMDDALLAHMRTIATLPRGVALGLADATGHWRAAVGNEPADSMIALLPPPGRPLPAHPAIAEVAGAESMYLATPLATADESPKVLALMAYPLADALRQYRGIIVVLLVALPVGLAAAVLGAWLIARNVARPLEGLARRTQRIAAGDYSPFAPLDRGDELGQLSVALAGMTRAIGEREDQIRFQATHEPITGLANRAALAEQIGKRLGGIGGAVLGIGLVRHGEIAHTVGREVADNLMRDAGGRLAALLDSHPLGCTGERTFAALLPEYDGEAALRLAAEIIECFEVPYRQDQLTIDAGVAVGIALYPDHGDRADLLLRRADVALLAAQSAESRASVYQPEADPHRPERLSLMTELRQALEHGDLELYFQPKLELATGRISGAEGLVRWHHPERGLIPPDSFIGLAEETGNIQRLTRWALRTGITQAAAWRDAGRNLRISVNLSVRDLADADLPRRVKTLLSAHDFPPESLVLEVTESAIMGEPDSAIAVLCRLADDGIALSIDDFGVGQASLAYLRRLPVREIKIDKSFVLNLAQDAGDRMIVRSVIDLGHGLGCRVTAEGVEDEASLDFLARFGCDYAQGYFIAKPLRAPMFEGFLEDRSPARPSVAVAS